MILTHLVLFSFLGGASADAAPPPAPAPAAETFSGGWTRKGRNAPWREESDSERERRIERERIEMGILPPDPEEPTAPEAPGATIEEGAAILALPPDPLAPAPLEGEEIDRLIAALASDLGVELRGEIEQRTLKRRRDEEALIMLLAMTL